jgi:hypothetical protein
MVRQILYTILGLLIGFFAAIFAIQLLLPNASKGVDLLLLAVVTIIFGVLAFEFARAANKGDSSGINSVRILFGLVGLLSIAGGMILIYGGLKVAFDPLIIATLIYAVLATFGYLYFAITFRSYVKPENLKYVNGFLIAQFVVSTILTIVQGFSANFSSILVNALFTAYFYRKVQSVSKAENKSIPQIASSIAGESPKI